MKTTTKIKLLSSATSAVVLMASGTAFAQEAADDTAADDQPSIVVTGSLIRNPNLEQANPVNVTTADQIELKQSNLAEDVLREVPGIVPSIGSAVNNGNGGSSYVDLRGLGSNRNVVLLDGNRIAPADLVGRTDLNAIPLALVSRVDALTGAAVTTYGADAITGVVNFVTKKDFAGLDLSLSEQITERGDGNYLRADMTVGGNFDDGRGNAVLSIGYQESDAVYQGARDFSNFGIDSYTGTLGGSGTGVPARITGTRGFLAGTTTPNTTGQWTIDAGGATLPNPNYNPNQPVSASNPLTRPVFAATPGGASNADCVTNVNNNCGTRQLGAGGFAQNTYAFFNFNPYNIFQTPFERYNIFAQANYEVSDSIEVYTRGMFSKTNVTTIIAPSGSFGGSITMNLNNPYLSATLRNQLCAFNTAAAATGILADGTVVSGQTAYTPRFTPAQCAAAATATGPTDPNYRTATFNLSRRAVEVGPRISEYSTTIFDMRIGFRGALSDAIDWDVNASYGESEKIQTIKNYTLQSRWRQASLAENTTTCTTNTNGCVPVNPFGPAGSISPAVASFLTANSSTAIRTSLGQVRGVVSGDLGVTSPGASQSVGFALGTEYRSYTAQQASDVLAKTPGELGGAGGAAPDIDGGYNVWEAYGELVVPLIEDKPLFHSLTLEAGARYSHYNVRGGGSNNTWTYKTGLSWEPVADLKFRGNYSRAVRAPNINELFSPFSVGLTTLAKDPCAGAAPVSNANLRAVCIAQGAPATTIGGISNPTASQANIFSGGSVNLDPETAKTWTVGAVFQPSFLPGFSVSVDYYNIRVDDVIGTALPGDYIDACFKPVTAASATNPDCTLIRRNPVTGGLDGDPATTRGLFAPITNNGILKTDGIDVIANYSRDLGFAKWQSSFVFNYTKSSKFQSLPFAATPSLDRECVGFYSGNCSFTGSLQPKFQWSWRNTLSIDAIDVSFLWRHVSGFVQEPDDIVQSQAAYVGNLPVGFGYREGEAVNFGIIPAADYFDLTVRFNVTDNFSMSATVQNLLDRDPPVIGSSIGSTAFNSGNTYPSTYDALGRRFAVSAKLKF